MTLLSMLKTLVSLMIIFYAYRIIHVVYGLVRHLSVCKKQVIIDSTAKEI